jgi:hypothetical protein
MTRPKRTQEREIRSYVTLTGIPMGITIFLLFLERPVTDSNFKHRARRKKKQKPKIN